MVRTYSDFCAEWVVNWFQPRAPQASSYSLGIALYALERFDKPVRHLYTVIVMKTGFKPIKRTVALPFLFCLTLTIVIGLGVFLGRSAPIYLAVAGPMSGDQQLNGEQMVQGVSMYLDEINREGGVNGHLLKLLVFDDQNDPDIAQQQAQAIVGDDRIVAVLGHFFSSTSLAAGSIYQETGITAISGSATAEAVTEDNDWYFRTIFSNKSQASFLANYAHHILNYSAVSIIYSQDEYGVSLAAAFANTFNALGGQIKQQWELPTPAEAAELAQQQMIQDLLTAKADNDDPGLIFLATHDIEAVKLITQMRRDGLDYPLLGGEALGRETVGDLFNQFPEEQAHPGYFSDGLYAVSPVIFEVASEKAQQFRDDYIERYEKEPSWIAATYYDAALLAAHAIEMADIQARSIPIQAKRERLRNALSTISTLERAVEGIEGSLFFNREGDSVRQFPMGRFQNQRFIPALVQLQPVTDLRQAVGIDQRIISGDVLTINSRYMHKVNVVYTGMDVNEISDLDIKSAAYTVDCYLWFRYQGEFDADAIEFTNLAEPLQIQELIAESDADGVHYRAYRIKGRFQGDFEFYDYPFDSQDLVVRFRHTDLKLENLVYVQDVVGMRETAGYAMLDKLEHTQALGSLSNWQAKRARFFQDVMRDDSTLGNPKFLDLQFDDTIRYSRFNMVIQVQRDSLGFILKNLLPVFLIIVAAYLILFIPADAIAPRAVAGLNALLTTAFFHVRLSNDLPTIGYVVAIEYIFYAMYLLGLFGLFTSIFSYVAFKQKQEQTVQRLDRLGKTVYPCALVIFASLFGYSYVINPLLAERTEAVSPSQPTITESVITEADLPAIETISLTLGSWRTDDEAQIKPVLEMFKAERPTIDITFSPTKNVDYRAVLLERLEAGEGPDLFYVRPFSGAQSLIQSGYLDPLDASPLQDAFPLAALEPWRGWDGELYALPMMAVSHGIYYNRDRFNQLGLDIPDTWEELLEIAGRFKRAGYTPFANGSQVGEILVENVLMNLAPNFIGGQAGRQAYLAGERCFDDENVVAAFQAIADLSPFLPDNHPVLTPTDSKQHFLSGDAVMWMSGSWEISDLEAAAPDFEWSVFAPPPPAGRPGYITFHPDFAIGLNASSEHKAEARQFLDWLSTAAAAEQFANELPGFFPLHNAAFTIDNPYAQAFLDLNEGRGLDARWASEQLGEGLPDGYSLMMEGALAIVQGERTPQEAAERLQKGLSQWFEPAQKCRPLG